MSKEDEMTDNEVNAETPKEETCNMSDLMRDTLQKTEESLREYKDKYFRALAETENMRKRLTQEKQESIAYAVDKMLHEFLTPVDNFESALGYTDNLSPELKNWAQGFKMIAGQFRDVLESHGITRFDSLGKKFDPYFHEAIETVISDEHEEGTVIAEIVKGYKHKERVLRVAKVKVAARAQDSKES